MYEETRPDKDQYNVVWINKPRDKFYHLLIGFYLFCDCTGTFNELPFGETIRGSNLQSSSLLDEEDTAMSELLHSSLDLETDLDNRTQYGTNLLSNYSNAKINHFSLQIDLPCEII